MGSILVNYVYWGAVGHTVEGIREAFAYSLANPDCDVHLVLSARTAVELTELCPWLSGVYTVDVDADRPVCEHDLSHIPREWDYVVFDRRVVGAPNAFGEYHSVASRYFRPQVGCGYLRDSRSLIARTPALGWSCLGRTGVSPAPGFHRAVFRSRSCQPEAATNRTTPRSNRGRS